MNETTRQLIVHKVKHNTKRLITSIKWVIFSIVVGIVAGSCGTAFYFALLQCLKPKGFRLKGELTIIHRHI